MERNLLLQRIYRSWSSGKEGHEIWQDLCEFCGSFANRSAHSLTELREIKARSTKTKGDLFEAFAMIYFEKIEGLSPLWNIKDLPYIHAEALGLTTKDMGIDLIGFKGRERYAIQVKYRTRPVSKIKAKTRRLVIGWKDLATFYGLVGRTGPFDVHCVFTSADGVRRAGRKTSKDLTIGHTALKSLSRDQWYSMVKDLYRQDPRKLGMKESNDERDEKKSKEPRLVGPSLVGSISSDRPSPESLRAKRLAYFTLLTA